MPRDNLTGSHSQALRSLLRMRLASRALNSHQMISSSLAHRGPQVHSLAPRKAHNLHPHLSPMASRQTPNSPWVLSRTALHPLRKACSVSRQTRNSLTASLALPSITDLTPTAAHPRAAQVSARQGRSAILSPPLTPRTTSSRCLLPAKITTAAPTTLNSQDLSSLEVLSPQPSSKTPCSTSRPTSITSSKVVVSILALLATR